MQCPHIFLCERERVMSWVFCTWFIPAFTNNKLGSPRGRTGEDGTTRCPCCSLKKSMNFRRTHLDEYSFCKSVCGKAEHFRERSEKTVKLAFNIPLRQAVRILTGAAILDFGSKVISMGCPIRFRRFLKGAIQSRELHKGDCVEQAYSTHNKIVEASLYKTPLYFNKLVLIPFFSSTLDRRCLNLQ